MTETVKSHRTIGTLKLPPAQHHTGIRPSQGWSQQDNPRNAGNASAWCI